MSVRFRAKSLGAGTRTELRDGANPKEPELERDHVSEERYFATPFKC